MDLCFFFSTSRWVKNEHIQISCCHCCVVRTAVGRKQQLPLGHTPVQAEEPDTRELVL